MIYIPILIVIIILLIDFYFTYKIRLNKINNESFINNDIITFNEPNPWTKIELNNKGNKHYLKINNINKYIDKIIIWKQLPFIKDDMIDIDIDNNYLIMKTRNEEEALVITNLIISYINGQINIESIMSKNIINKSIAKAKKYNLVGTKLKELIKDGIHNMKLHENINEVEVKNIETVKQPQQIQPVNTIHIPEVVQNVPLEPFVPQSRIVPYEGNEYATINF